MKRISTNRVRRALQWREDTQDGEMVQAHGYTKTKMFYVGDVSTQEFNAIVASVNAFYEAMGSKLRILHAWGEIIPALVNKDGVIVHDASNVRPFHVAAKVPSR